MPIFLFNPHNQYYIATNLKVGYSSLSAVPYLREVTRKRFLMMKCLGRVPHRGYLLTRNPYHRILSFYNDKLQLNPLLYNNNGFQWQKCQREIAAMVGIKWSKVSRENAVNLIDCSFKRFVNGLYNYLQRYPVWMIDRHLHPQSYLLAYLKIIGCGNNLSFVQLENQRLTNSVVGMVCPLKNSTNSILMLSKYDKESYRKISEIYKSDIESFKYNNYTMS